MLRSGGSAVRIRLDNLSRRWVHRRRQISAAFELAGLLSAFKTRAQQYTRSMFASGVTLGATVELGKRGSIRSKQAISMSELARGAPLEGRHAVLHCGPSLNLE